MLLFATFILKRISKFGLKHKNGVFLCADFKYYVLKLLKGSATNCKVQHHCHMSSVSNSCSVIYFKVVELPF